jgi:ABC-type dipeptide/oligopeptide/nickel transport system ATPase component
MLEAMALHLPERRSTLRERVVETLARVGIPSPAARARDYPHQFSGGMAQRVMIGMGVSCVPSLLIADEPTTALDVTIQAQILDLLQRLRRERALAVLFITHDLGVVREFADRVVLMRAGEKVEEGAVAEIFARPRHAYTKGLLACRPRFGTRGTRLPTVEEMIAAEKPA